MNMLEVFNKVEAHLLAQGVRSMGGYSSLSDGCAYRGDGGKQCAVGCLIKDEFYHKDLEGWSISAVKRGGSVDKALIKSGIDLSPEMAQMLSDLQYLHDAISGPKVWELKLQKLRVKYFGNDTSNKCDEKTAIDRHNNQWVGLTHEEKL